MNRIKSRTGQLACLVVLLLLMAGAPPGPAIGQQPSDPTAAVVPAPSRRDVLAPAVQALLRAGAEHADDDDALEPTLAGITALGAPALPAVTTALKQPDEAMRVVAAKALAKFPGTTAATALVGALRDESPSVRTAAVESLGVLGDRRAVPALLKQLQTDPEAAVHYACLTSLGMIGDPAASATLVKYTSDEDGPARMWAMRALCTMKDPQAPGRVLELVRDPNPDVRAQTLVTCEAALDTPQGHVVLIDVALSADFQSSVLARRALGNYRQQGATVAALTEQMRAAALAARQQPSRRLNAAFVLADLGDVQAVDGLIGGLKDSNALTRLMAARQLGQLGDRRAVPALIDALGDAEAAVAATAYNSVRQFAQSGDASATEAAKNYKGKKFDEPPSR